MTQIKPLLNWLCLQALLDSLPVSEVDILRADFTQKKNNKNTQLIYFLQAWPRIWRTALSLIQRKTNGGR